MPVVFLVRDDDLAVPADGQGRVGQDSADPGLGGYLILIVVGLFVPIIAVVVYLAIALYYVIPFRRWGVPVVLEGQGGRLRAHMTALTDSTMLMPPGVTRRDRG